MSFRGFSRDPAVRRYGPGQIEVLEPLLYIDQTRGFRVLVPAGFICDGPSVPRWGWPLLKFGFVELLPAGLLHDYLSRRGAKIIVTGVRIPVPGKLWAARTMGEAVATRKGASSSDARRVRWATALGVGYWQRKPVDWRP